MQQNNAIPVGPTTDRTAIFMGVLIIPFLMLVAGCGSSTTDKDMENITYRLKRLETRMAAFELNNDADNERNQKFERFMLDSERRQADLVMSLSRLEKQLQAGTLKVHPKISAEDSKTVAIPVKEKDKTPVPSEGGAAAESQYHEVQKGETVYSISRQYGLEVAELKKLNGLESDVIVPGQKLRIK